MYASYWIWSRKRELKANKKRGLRVHAYSSLISQERIESYMNLRPRINSSNWSRKRELKANSYIPRVIFVYLLWSRKRELKVVCVGVCVWPGSVLISQERIERLTPSSSTKVILLWLISQERIESSWMGFMIVCMASDTDLARENWKIFLMRLAYLCWLSGWSRKRELKERLRIVFLILATYLISQERIERGPSSAPNVATQPFWSRKRELKDTALGVLAYTGAVRWSRKRELKVHPCSGMGNRRWQPDLARENWKQKPA